MKGPWAVTLPEAFVYAPVPPVILPVALYCARNGAGVNIPMKSTSITSVLLSSAAPKVKIYRSAPHRPLLCSNGANGGWSSLSGFRL